MTKLPADEFREMFFQESEELLEAMHDGFEHMVAETDDDETIHAVFRAVHSIKGGAGAFGLDDLVSFAHHFETALEKIRSGAVQNDASTLSLFQRCGDQLADLVTAARKDMPADPATSQTLRAELDDVIGHIPEPEEAEVVQFEPLVLEILEIDAPTQANGYAICFRPREELFSSGNEPVLLFRALEKLGELLVYPHLEMVDHTTLQEPMIPVLYWDLQLVFDGDEDEIRMVFDFVDDVCELDITPLAQADPGSENQQPMLADFIRDSAPADAALSPQPSKTGDNNASVANGAVAEMQQPKTKRPGDKSNATPVPTIRVDLNRVDRLINLVGELVIKEAMVSQSITKLGLISEDEVSVGFDSLKQLAGEIQESVMAIRAQPVKPMFQRMARIVREVEQLTGKQIKFVSSGENTEVDKTVIERLVDPLTHMVRNAADHGLESPEERQRLGKPARGKVTLSAAHRSGRVVIEVSDDGSGIDRAKVRAIAESKGLVAQGVELSTVEIDNLLFLPGFSSKEEVSELSGRGVGLDVARSEIQALGGRVTIQSTPGKGSIFSISLPLTLAVMDGMVVKVAKQTMVVPITAIQESLQPKNSSIHMVGSNGKVLESRGNLIPIVDLGEVCGFRNAPESFDDHVLLLIETDDQQRCALVVDCIQDQRQVVIKSLETNYGQVDGISAATILGDGRIALIVDPDSIVRKNSGHSVNDVYVN